MASGRQFPVEIFRAAAPNLQTLLPNLWAGLAMPDRPYLCLPRTRLTRYHAVNARATTQLTHCQIAFQLDASRKF